MKHYPVILSLATAAFLITGISCKKDKAEKTNPITYNPRKVKYEVSGLRIKLNFIDSNSIFQTDQLFEKEFSYEFMRQPGTSIGITVNLQDSSGHIDSWKIYIDNKLYANAFSEGGAYLSIPYP